jgi:hypothetical protein
MTVPNDEDRLRRGEETDRWLKLAWKNAPESVNLHLPIHWSSNAVILLSPHDRRMLSLQTLSSIQTQSMQTKGRHAGWAKIQDCVKACRALSKSPDTGYFSCTESEVHTMVERCGPKRGPAQTLTKIEPLRTKFSRFHTPLIRDVLTDDTVWVSTPGRP